MKNVILISIAFVMGCGISLSIFLTKKKAFHTDYIDDGKNSMSISFKPKNGTFLPDSSVLNTQGGVVSTPKVAAEIGISILQDLYGEEVVKEEIPFEVVKDFNTWNLRGTFRKYGFGGVANIIIDRKTGMVIDFFHEE